MPAQAHFMHANNILRRQIFPVQSGCAVHSIRMPNAHFQDRLQNVFTVKISLRGSFGFLHADIETLILDSAAMLLDADQEGRLCSKVV